MLAPYDAEDARGMIKAAVRDQNPVVVLENELLYGTSFMLSDEAQGTDYVTPIGKCRIMRAVLHTHTHTHTHTHIGQGRDDRGYIYIYRART